MMNVKDCVMFVYMLGAVCCMQRMYVQSWRLLAPSFVLNVECCGVAIGKLDVLCRMVGVYVPYFGNCFLYIGGCVLYG